MTRFYGLPLYDRDIPCINVSEPYNKRQEDALFLKFIFDKELCMFRTDLLSIIRSLKTVYTAISIFHDSSVDCLLARSGWSSILTSLIPVMKVEIGK